MNILLVDDQNIFLHAMTILLRREIPGATISCANSGHQAITLLNNEKIDLILLDVNMPVMNGLEVATYVAKNFPLVKIIMLTHVAGLAMIVSLAKIAHGILFKEADANELKEVIASVMRGERGFCSVSKEMVLNNMAYTEIPYVNFNKYETMLVKLMTEGKTSKEIGVVLSKTEKAVKRLREDLLKKTKAKNTSELIAFAYQNGII